MLLYVDLDGNDRIVLPPEHRKALIECIHCNLLHGEHAGITTVAADIRRKFYWPNLIKDVTAHIAQCDCQYARDRAILKAHELKLFPATRPNKSVCIDHVGPLPVTEFGYEYCTNIVDRYTGFAECVPTKHIDAFSTAMNFLLHWVCRYGPPEQLISDNDSDFRSELLHHLNSMMDVKHNFSVPYHAQTNGAVERFNAVLKRTLRVIGQQKGLDFTAGDSWHLYVPIAAAIHNNRLSRRTNFKFCPNDLFIGKRVESPIEFRLNINDKRYVKSLGHEQYANFIKNLLRLKHQMANKELRKYDAARKKLADDRIKRGTVLNVGDCCKYWHGVYPAKGSNKLGISWSGPYKILSVFNNGINYLLQHMRHREIYFVANISRLARAKPSDEFKREQLKSQETEEKSAEKQLEDVQDLKNVSDALREQRKQSIELIEEEKESKSDSKEQHKVKVMNKDYEQYIKEDLPSGSKQGKDALQLFDHNESDGDSEGSSDDLEVTDLADEITDELTLASKQ